MIISPPLIDFLEAWEGRELEVYLDSKGLPTIGIGHLLLPGEDFSNGITEEECDDLFLQDIGPRMRALTTLCGPSEQQQFDAMFSLAFNIGIQRFSTSSCLHWHKAGRPAAAAHALLLWNKETKGGQIVQSEGLTNRREAEFSIYMDADYSGRP